jgi:uncharacterized repeat protein (TIGR03847 family)
MARRILRFDPPERFIAGTVGEPGNRTFHLQAVGGGISATVIVEKTQVAVLARRVADMLRDLAEGGALRLPTRAPRIKANLPRLVEPFETEFRVGTIALAWDPSTTRLTLEFRDDMSEESEGEAPPPINDAPVGPDVLRIALSADAALDFAELALELAAAGRPVCPLCNAPIEATGHRCATKAPYLN